MKRLWKCLALLFWLMTASMPVSAHSISVAYLELTEDDGAIRIELDVAVRELALRLPLDRDRDEVVTWGEIELARPQIEAWAVSGLKLRSSKGDCGLTPQELAIRRYDSGAFIVLRFVAPCAFRHGSRLEYGLFFEDDPKHRAVATVRRAGTVAAILLSADARILDTGESRGGDFMRFLRDGVHHILIGYDHLAFVLSLLLPAALVRGGGRWLPAERSRDAFFQVFGIVTAFTLAHSITLGLAALGWVTPVSRWVEAAIAASVILAALNNLRPLVVDRLWLAGFAFGLVHGFGFAGALSESGIDGDVGVVALLGFNLGVELGQLMVVSVALPVLLLLRGKRWYRDAAMPGVSLVIAGVALFWLSERLAG
jgi:HupE / UreJ protein